VHSKIKTGVSKRIQVGDDKEMAIVGAAQAAEKLNAEYGDSIDPVLAVSAVRQFLENSGADLKCRSCGWTDSNGGKCTQHGHTIDPGGTCNLYRHVFNVVDPAAGKVVT